MRTDRFGLLQGCRHAGRRVLVSDGQSRLPPACWKMDQGIEAAFWGDDRLPQIENGWKRRILSVPTLKSKLNPRSADFQANAAAMQTWSMTCATRSTGSRGAAGGTARQKHLARGKAPPRRVAGLLDPGTPFLEISQLAAHGMYGGDVPAAPSSPASAASMASMHDRRQRRDGEGRHLLPDDGEEAPAAQEIALENRCRASTWSIPAAPSCRCGTRSSRTANTSAHLLQPGQPCRPRASRRSPS